MAKALVDHPTFADRDLSSMRGGTFAALLPQDLQADADVPKANSLGMTETLGPHTFDAKDSALPPDKEGSFGLSVPGVEHQIVDPVTLEDVPVGETGELWLRGYSLMLGPPQAGAGRHLHPRRLVPHRRRRALRRGRPLLLHRPDGRPHQVVGHEHHPPRRRAGARGAARGGDGLRHRRRPPRAGRGRGRRRRPAPRRGARRGRGPRAGQGGDRALQGAAPRRRLRRPDRAAVARLGQGRPPPAHRRSSSRTRFGARLVVAPPPRRTPWS